MNRTVKLIVSIALPVLVGAVSGFFTSTGVDSWYQTINRPSWNPPGWVFGPVWTTLYVLMGIALFMVWRTPVSAERTKALWLFGIQLTLNFFWSFIFFYLENIGVALIEIVVLWLFILLSIFAFARISKTAAWLLVPYISWVIFATLLTYAIWKLN